MVRIQPPGFAAAAAAPVRPASPVPIKNSHDSVRFGKNTRTSRHERSVTVTSPLTGAIADAGKRAQAEGHLQTMGRLLNELGDVYYSEWIRQFNEAKAAFQDLTAREVMGEPGFDPAMVYRRFRHGAARPVTFDIRLSDPAMLENRNLRNLDLGGVCLQADAPVSLRGARLQKANLSNFSARPGLDLAGAEYDRETRFYKGVQPGKQGMVLTNPRYEKGPWMAYSNLFEEWPRNRLDRLRRWWGLRQA